MRNSNIVDFKLLPSIDKSHFLMTLTFYPKIDDKPDINKIYEKLCLYS